MIRHLFRSGTGLIALLTGSALVIALISQHIFDMPPCPWCIMQRILFLFIFGVAVVALSARGLRRLMSWTILVTAILGVITAVHQYTISDNPFACELTLADRIITGSGLDTLAPWLFGVYASCFEANINLFGVPFVLWSLALFVVVIVLALSTLFAIRRR